MRVLHQVVVGKPEISEVGVKDKIHMRWEKSEGLPAAKIELHKKARRLPHLQRAAACTLRDTPLAAYQ